MNLRNLVCSLLLLVSVNSNAQDPIQIIRPDTIRINESFGAVHEYPRPKIYDTWFKRIVECEGIQMPPQEEIDRLRFFVVNSETFKTDSAGSADNAATWSRQHLIVISLPKVWSYEIVAHEFLHFALWYDYGAKYSLTHPSEYYDGRCGVTEFNQ